MSILSAQSIRRLKPIEPFSERTVQDGMTYGLSAAGYDVRLDQHIDLLPGQFSLASTVERFFIPSGIIAFVHDKSSLARRGLAVQNTVIEPGWTGYLTLELTNHSTETITLLRGTPISQIVFHWLDEETDQPYDGKYQNQERGAQPTRFD